ncbi:acid phosphatase, putative [Trypanosoma cruzi marinkellei]|uniref:Acid phosphatase, putative n=1 Tax=Trypanosoma cruzi marinkellei TaxID=85056 RepID=K2NCE5_TRYCR|nr:acid phosphatase, putative [Trypanosoma cruzi marinkellei]
MPEWRCPGATMPGSCLISGTVAKHWVDSTLAGHIANLRAPQVINFEIQLLLPIVCGLPGSWESSKVCSLLKGPRLVADYTNAVADVQNQNVQLYSQVGEGAQLLVGTRIQQCGGRRPPCGMRRRRAGDKPTPRGEGRQMELSRVKIWPRMALPHSHINRVVSLPGACQYPRFPDANPRDRDGGSTPKRPRGIWGDHISIPRCLCLPALSPWKGIQI